MDHYRTLDVAKNATKDEIRAAYRKAAAEHHPDRGGSPAVFRKIQAAYDTLSDAALKKSYDLEQGRRPVENLKNSVRTLVQNFVEKCRKPNT